MKVTQLCPTLWDLMNCSSPGFFVHEISQERILGQIATSFSWGSLQPRNWTWVSWRVPIRPRNPSSMYIPKRNGKKMYIENLYINVHVALSIIEKKWKQSNAHQWWVDKQGDYSPIEVSKILITCCNMDVPWKH